MHPSTDPKPRLTPEGQAGQTGVPESATVSGMTTPKHAAVAYRIGWPLAIALALIAAVWVGGAVWSFAEQTAFADFKHFEIPQLLPLVIDGLAVAMASVAWAASLDGRPAIGARLGAAIAIAMSAASNAAWAWERSGADPGTVALAIAVPVAAMVAFEVLLAEVRKQVQRFRGTLPPVQIPYPHWLRWGLSLWSTFWQWRRLVLELTRMEPAFAAAAAAAGRGAGTPAEVSAEGVAQGSAETVETATEPLPEPLDGTPAEPLAAPLHPCTPDGADTPAPGVLHPDSTPTAGTPANGPGTPVQDPARNPDRTPTGPVPPKGAAPQLTSVGTPTGTPSGTVGRDGADTPAEYPADEVLLPILRDPARVPRDPDGTVPTKRAMRLLGVGRPRAERMLKAEGLYRDTPPSTPGGTVDGTPAAKGADTPGDTANGSTQHPTLAGVTS